VELAALVVAVLVETPRMQHQALLIEVVVEVEFIIASLRATAVVVS
jgi:hypothetical protein